LFDRKGRRTRSFQALPPSSRSGRNAALPSRDKHSLFKMAEVYDRQAKAADDRSREQEAPDV